MPGVRPRAAQYAAIQAASGVFPVPPTDRLPTAIVGRGRRTASARARTARSFMTVQYTPAGGVSGARVNRAAVDGPHSHEKTPAAGTGARRTSRPAAPALPSAARDAAPP